MAVESASLNHGNEFVASVDEIMIDVPGERGIGIVVIDYHTRTVSYKNMFDTSQESGESEHLVKLLHRIKDGCYVIMGVKGDGARKLTKEARNEIENLGSDEIHKLEYGDSWAMIVRKGNTTSIREARDHKHAVTLNRTDDF